MYQCGGIERVVMQSNCTEDHEVIREFLIESRENLSRLDRELVALEKSPHDSDLLGSIFRTMHTIKGSCGFLAYGKLERIAHQAESLLSELRDGVRQLSPELVSLILEAVDATRQVLDQIEKSGNEGDFDFDPLIECLRLAVEGRGVESILDVDKSTTERSILPDRLLDPEPTSEEATKKKLGPWDNIERRKQADDSGDEEQGPRNSSAADTNIRVGVGLLNKLMDLVGELVLVRNQILQFNAEREDPALNATSQRLNLITSELQEGVMKTRMQPIGIVWHTLPRIVRDLALSLGKQVEVKMDGADTELDRTIIEAIKDPLIHLVRNSCDHGIETPEVRSASNKSQHGTMTLRAYHEGGQVNIEVGDDGTGVDIGRVKAKAIENGLMRQDQADKLSDREALNLIFHPGFSTARDVTNLSGRGVGMDVVKSNIEKIGGVVDVSSRQGHGTTVKIRIPLTLAIIPGLVVNSGGERFVIPQVSLLELIRLEAGAAKHIEYVHGTPVYRRRERLLPVAYLNQILGLATAVPGEAASMVVLQAEDRQFGLVVDGINDTQEIVVKPLGKQLKGLTLYAGATIMGDGQVALILDVLGVGRWAGVLGEIQQRSRTVQPEATETEQQRLLLFQTGAFKRLAVPLSLVARLEEFSQSAIEYAGGGRVVQYRDGILPLVSLSLILEPGTPEQRAPDDPLQVVVFNDGGRAIGMVVDKILDVAEAAVIVRQKSTRRGLLGSAVVGQLVTDFVDLGAVITAAKGGWSQTVVGPGDGGTILIVDPSPFWTGLLRSALEMAGYGVLQATTSDTALQILETCSVKLIAVGLDLPESVLNTLTSELSNRPEWKHIPALALAESVEQTRAFDFRRAGFDDCQTRSDTVTELESIARLIAAAGSAFNPPVWR
jgi:two-component system, chemotaxis family, sensor kinase CheA